MKREKEPRLTSETYTVARLSAHQAYITCAHFLKVDAGMPEDDPCVKVEECCSVEVTIVAHRIATITPPSHSSSSQARCIAGIIPLFLSRLTMRMVISIASQIKLRSGCHESLY